MLNLFFFTELSPSLLILCYVFLPGILWPVGCYCKLIDCIAVLCCPPKWLVVIAYIYYLRSVAFDLSPEVRFCVFNPVNTYPLLVIPGSVEFPRIYSPALEIAEFANLIDYFRMGSFGLSAAPKVGAGWTGICYCYYCCYFSLSRY